MRGFVPWFHGALTGGLARRDRASLSFPSALSSFHQRSELEDERNQSFCPATVVFVSRKRVPQQLFFRVDTNRARERRRDGEKYRDECRRPALSKDSCPKEKKNGGVDRMAPVTVRAAGYKAAFGWIRGSMETSGAKRNSSPQHQDGCCDLKPNPDRKFRDQRMRQVQRSNCRDQDECRDQRVRLRIHYRFISNVVGFETF